MLKMIVDDNKKFKFIIFIKINGFDGNIYKGYIRKKLKWII